MKMQSRTRQIQGLLIILILPLLSACASTAAASPQTIIQKA